MEAEAYRLKYEELVVEFAKLQRDYYNERYDHLKTKRRLRVENIRSEVLKSKLDDC